MQFIDSILSFCSRPWPFEHSDVADALFGCDVSGVWSNPFTVPVNQPLPLDEVVMDAAEPTLRGRAGMAVVVLCGGYTLYRALRRHRPVHGGSVIKPLLLTTVGVGAIAATGMVLHGYRVTALAKSCTVASCRFATSPILRLSVSVWLMDKLPSLRISWRPTPDGLWCSAALITATTALLANFDYFEGRAAFRTAVLQSCVHRLGNTTMDIRAAFIRECAARLPAGHPHRDAAALRNEASSILTAVATRVGRRVYYVSPAPREHGDGERLYYTTRDVIQQPRSDPLRKDHLISMVDVDYYVNLADWIRYGLPIVLYTFVPQDVVGSVADGHFYTNADNTVSVVCNGSHEYRHNVWKLDGDEVVANYWWGSVHCMIATWYIDGRDTTRRLVMIVPDYTVYTPLLRWCFECPVLRRLQMVHNGLYLLDIVDPDGKSFVSVGVVGTRTGVRLPRAVFDTVLLKARQIGNKITSADVERIIRSSGIDMKLVTTAAIIMYDVVSLYKPNYTIDTITATGFVKTPLHYQAPTPLVLEDGKEYARQISPPLVTSPALCPVASLNNDVATVQGRIRNVANTVIPPHKYVGYAADFLTIIPANAGAPMDINEVVEEMDGPRQRARAALEVPRLLSGLCQVRAFMKRESYGQPKDPRNISTVPTDHTLRLSTYTKPFKKDVLSHFKWFTPGCTPQEIVDRVRELAAQNPVIAVVDYTRLDGTISEWLRTTVELAAYRRWYTDTYQAEVGELIVKEMKSTGITKQGVRYSPGCSRLSGSPLTTDGNTLICAFVAYCGARNTGSNHAQALDKIGMIYGDDGLLPGSIHQGAVDAARDLGLILKCDLVEAGNPVPFLGRVFADPWSGGCTYQDPVRTISKLHLTVADSSVPLDIAALNKALGYIVNDDRTPVIGNWCRYIIRRSNSRGYGSVPDKYKEHCKKDTPYHAMAGWPHVDWDEDLVLSQIAKAFGVHASDVKYVCQQLDNATDDDEFPCEILHTDRTLSGDVVIGSEYHADPGNRNQTPNFNFVTSRIEPATCSETDTRPASSELNRELESASPDTPSPVLTLAKPHCEGDDSNMSSVPSAVCGPSGVEAAHQRNPPPRQQPPATQPARPEVSQRAPTSSKRKGRRERARGKARQLHHSNGARTYECGRTASHLASRSAHEPRQPLGPAPRGGFTRRNPPSADQYQNRELLRGVHPPDAPAPPNQRHRSH